MKNTTLDATFSDGVLTIVITPRERPDLAVCITEPYETEAEARAFARGRCCDSFNGKMLFWPGMPDPMQGFH